MSAEPVTAPGPGAVLNTRLDAVFNPASVAIYGISDRTSGRIAENMTVPGVPFYGVNPTKTEACGVRCYPSMAACPAVPEMVVMGVGHGRIEAAIDDVLSVEGVRAVITPGLGNESGAEGAAIAERIGARLRAGRHRHGRPELHGRRNPRLPVALDRQPALDVRARAGRDAGPLRARSARSWCRSARGSASARSSRPATRR